MDSWMACALALNFSTSLRISASCFSSKKLL